MQNQAFNPFLPGYEYIPDGEPYVFDGRVYLYGSHDRFNGAGYCLNDYVCWSAPVDALWDWRYEGVIYRKDQDPDNPGGKLCMYAPDLQKGPDGRYYLFYGVDNQGKTMVAVCDTPAGAFSYYGRVKYAEGDNVNQFDPAIFVDDDGRVFHYSGFSPRPEHIPPGRFDNKRADGAYCYELEQDMLTVKNGPKLIAPGPTLAAGTGFDDHAFFEASSMRKINGKYYFIYASINYHELCYAVSDQPDGTFAFGGTLISIGDVGLNGITDKTALNYLGNTHGSVVEIGGKWYVFYHRQTNRHGYSRQACAEEIHIQPNGSIPQAELTSCGLNGGPLAGTGRYEARTACHLFSKKGAGWMLSHFPETADEHPYFTQTGDDREDNNDQYIANLRDGACAGFKYFDLRETKKIAVEVRGDARGEMRVSYEIGGEVVAVIPVSTTGAYMEFSAAFNKPGTEKSALYFTYVGSGAVDFSTFILSP